MKLSFLTTSYNFKQTPHVLKLSILCSTNVTSLHFIFMLPFIFSQNLYKICSGFSKCEEKRCIFQWCICCIITYHKKLPLTDFIDSDRDNHHHHHPCSVLFLLKQQNDFKFYTPIFFKSNFEVIIMENYKMNKMYQLHFWLTLVHSCCSIIFHIVLSLISATGMYYIKALH